MLHVKNFSSECAKCNFGTFPQSHVTEKKTAGSIAFCHGSRRSPRNTLTCRWLFYIGHGPTESTLKLLRFSTMGLVLLIEN